MIILIQIDKHPITYKIMQLQGIEDSVPESRASLVESFHSFQPGQLKQLLAQSCVFHVEFSNPSLILDFLEKLAEVEFSFF